MKYLGTETLESMSQAKFYNKWSLGMFKKFLRGKIIEVGCGIGSFTPTLAQYGEVIGIDIEKKFVKKNSDPKIKVGYGDIERGEYFFKNETFDTAVCINVLEHIQDDKKALKNLYLLLKREGYLILLVPIHDFLYGEIDKNIGHLRRYNPGELKSQLKKLGFTIIKSKKLNFLGAIGWFVAGRILKNKQVDEGKIKLFNLIVPFILSLENIVEPPIGTSVLIIARK